MIIFSNILIKLIKGYRLIISPLLGPSCRYQPTCSEYSIEALKEFGLIKGASLALDYKKLGYTFIAYIGIFLEKTHLTNYVLDKLESIPYTTVAHITTGRFNIFCKVRCKDTDHAKEIIFMIDDIEGVSRTETMISLEESINDKKRLMHKIFNEIK